MQWHQRLGAGAGTGAVMAGGKEGGCRAEFALEVERRSNFPHTPTLMSRRRGWGAGAGTGAQMGGGRGREGEGGKLPYAAELLRRRELLVVLLTGRACQWPAPVVGVAGVAEPGRFQWVGGLKT